MLIKAYSIRDAKADSFSAPFYKNTHGQAERDFQELTKDENSFICKYPEDYDLYYVGQFDVTSGKLETLDTPQHIVKAIQLKPN